MSQVEEHERVLLIDIDGTITFQHSREWGSNDIIPGSVEAVNALKAQGYYIVFWTGRVWDDYQVTKDMLDDAGFEYDDLICGKPVTMDLTIIDDKPLTFLQVPRNKGVQCVI